MSTVYRGIFHRFAVRPFFCVLTRPRPLHRHPQSIDALCAIPSRYSNAQSTILTGSSDGLLRAVQLFPTKLLGVVADHGEFPIERIAVDMGGEGRWVGSVGHEEVLKLTGGKGVDVIYDPVGLIRGTPPLLVCFARPNRGRL